MPEKVVLEVEVVGDKAIIDLEKLQEGFEKLNEAKEKSKELDIESQNVTANQSKIIRLFDQALGGVVSRIKSFIEGTKALIVETRALTAAQIKANLAFLANPYVAAGAAVSSLVVLLKKSYDEGVPILTTLTNLFKSMGDYAKFVALQSGAVAETFEFQTNEQIKQTERAIALLQAFGEETLELEIENQERKLSLLKKGTDEYEDELTKLLVLRAKKYKQAGEKEAEEYEKGRQAKLKELQEQEQLEADQRALSAQQDEFDKGFLDGEAYAAGKRAIFDEIKKEEEPYFAYLDPNKDPELDPEFQYKLKLNDAILNIEKEHSERIKAARQDLFLNLVSIFGAETKLGKAFLIAKQIETAALLAQEVRKTITFSQQSAARTAQAAAEAVAVGTIATAQGAAETAKVGFPQNIPLLIAYAAQAAGIVSAIRQAVRGVPTAQAAFLPAQPGLPPQIVQTIPNVTPVGRSATSQLAEAIEGQQNRPIRAYVVSSDVTSAQELDRNIVRGASI